jgi:N-methylhydantoinase B/oxoprolinase/acetone carboxylase alpha subunit
MIRLYERYGVDTVMSAAYEWMDYSERMLRAQIERIPDGEYVSPTAWLDDDGRNRGQRLRVETKVVVRGDSITVDLTGSSPEVPTGYNVPFEGSLLVGVYFAIRTLLLDEATFPEHVPQNDGIFRPVDVVAPKGSIFNPNFPRACFARFTQVQRVIDNIILALSPVLPEQATGGNSAACHYSSYAGFVEETGQYWVYLEVNGGCYGGRFGKDGMDSVDTLMANTRNNPIEDLDMRYPIRNEAYELRPEPAAPGRWRGGVGVMRRNRFMVDGVYSVEGERHTDAPRGIFGGWDGLCSEIVKNPDAAEREMVHSKVTGMEIEAGELMEITEPVAGGYGDPLDRPAEMVREDVFDDFTSLELARAAYGVVIDPQTFEVDVKATDDLRASMRAGQDGGPKRLRDFLDANPAERPINPISAASDRELAVAAEVEAVL